MHTFALANILKEQRKIPYAVFWSTTALVPHAYRLATGTLTLIAKML